MWIKPPSGRFFGFWKGRKGLKWRKGFKGFIQSDKFSCTPSTLLTLCTPFTQPKTLSPLHPLSPLQSLQPLQSPPTVPFKPNDFVGEWGGNNWKNSMAIFKVSGQKLLPIRTQKVDLESDIQKLTESNLELVFGLKFVVSEFQLHGLRVDTLAFNEESQSFVIIEYKRDKSFSVIDQGYAYLALMLNNKADFILEYNECTGKSLKRDDIDWSQSRVIFIAGSFTTYQQNAINFRGLPFELWEVTKFDNETILYNQIKAPESAETIKTISKNESVSQVNKEVKSYKEDDLITKNSGGEKLFNQIKEKVALIDENIETYATRHYIAFRLPNNWRIIFVVKPRKEKLVLEFTRSHPKDFKDPDKRLRYIPYSMKQFNQHISIMDVGSEKDVEYAVFLLKQQYDRFMKEYNN